MIIQLITIKKFSLELHNIMNLVPVLQFYINTKIYSSLIKFQETSFVICIKTIWSTIGVKHTYNNVIPKFSNYITIFNLVSYHFSMTYVHQL